VTKVLKKIIFIRLCDDCGEVEGAFTPDEELIDTWSNNDANWRGEYFAGLLEHMGYEEADPVDDAQHERLEQRLKDVWNDGQTYSDEDEDE
jgi:hypothetical protein